MRPNKLTIYHLYKKHQKASGVRNVVNNLDYEEFGYSTSYVTKYREFFKKKKSRSDLFFIHGLHNKMLFLGLFFSLLGFKIILIPHGQFSINSSSKEEKFVNIIWRLIVKKAISRAYKIQFLNQSERLYFFVQVPEKKILLAGNGINKNYLIMKPKNTKSKDIIIGYIGRINEDQKQIISLVRKFIEFNKDGRNQSIRLKICGPDSECKKELSEILRNSNSQPIKLLNAVYSDDEKKSLIDTFDYAILPSKFEGEPIFALEAAARAVPTIATLNSNVSNIFKTTKLNRFVSVDEIISFIFSNDFLSYHQDEFLNESTKTLKEAKKRTWHHQKMNILKSLSIL